MGVSPCSTSSYFQYKEGTWNMIFCMKIYGLFLAEMTWCGPQGACRCCQELFQSPLYIWGRLWDTQEAINVSPCRTASHFMCGKGAQNLIFWMILRVLFYGNDMVLIIRGLKILSETLLSIPIYLGKVMIHSSSMDASLCNTVSNFLCEEGVQKLLFYKKFVRCFW